MKKYQLAILFTQAPFGTSTSREGLDALLAASAFIDESEIAICFLHDGVFNLLANQQPDLIMQKDHISTFKLIELYELTECFICQESVQKRRLEEQDWLLGTAQFVSYSQILDVLTHSEKVLTF
ncbi:sulfurtransferase complex subunit TusC [Frederiksenia canicola]|uniref:tRNA 2-thiouridine synthesizing protein C n=1 Tax=Frederiksenia canicola TaxID=123824 RepID=A0AAE7C1I7_9PAST|nr:sulfurtransferase complex subunit TusC [Frederiksenia canicola]QIM64380.1 tRNA 2-thiouridine(34) synthase TusC [Frederiksenia canicola]RPE92010.1 tRNA 2-thiouridine synthesizing protein C [Frederiksenia canicola]